MLILALDTTGRVASAALCRDGEVIAACQKDSMMDHSRTILPVCRDMLQDAGLGFGDIDVFAAVCGPGSYTGIRIGVAAVKGFAFGQDKPCAAVSTLEAAAWADTGSAGEKLALVKARPQEYFAARFCWDGSAMTRLTPDGVCAESEVLALLKERPGLRLCGSGAGCLPLAGEKPYAVQDAASAARCAWAKVKAGDTVSCHQLTPSYLRPTQAERMRQQKG